MTKNPLSRKTAREIQLEAEKIARSLQTPDQTKEETRLIARGIQRGIETYRRQQAEKSRDFDKKLKKLKLHENREDAALAEPQERIVYRQHWLPWVLFSASLVLSIYLAVRG